MFFSVVAHSEDIDAQDILEELLEQCRDELGERVPQAGILYCTIDLEHDRLVQGIDDAWPGIALVGCTTAGEFSSRLGFREDSATLVLLGSDTVDITASLGRDVSKDVGAACARAIALAKSKTTTPPRSLHHFAREPDDQWAADRRSAGTASGCKCAGARRHGG